MSTTVTIPIKRGDKYPLSCEYTIDGVAAQLPVGIRVQLRDYADDLIAELTVTVIDASIGQYSLYVDATGWPIGMLRGDIQYTDTIGDITSTETFAVDVRRDYTHD